jgi:hypothetical protein
MIPLKPTTVKQKFAQSAHNLSVQSTRDAACLCCYQNFTPVIQVIRSAPEPHLPNWYLERVVFPGQRLLFEAPAWAKVHIYSSSPAGSLLDDTISCDRLQVTEQ